MTKYLEPGYLSYIQSLEIPDNEDPATIHHSIGKYADIIEKITEQMTMNYKTGQIDFLHRNMLMTVHLLKSIHAKSLEKIGEAILGALKQGKTDICKTSLQPFISKLLLLSDELKEAQRYITNGKLP